MRKFAALFAFAIVITAGASAQADRIRMPCDAPLAGSFGTGVFTGSSDTASFGDIKFQRVQPTFVRFQLNLFNNCATYTDAAADDKPPSTHDRVTRWWLGGISLYGSIAPETTSLGFHNEPKQPTDNALTRAELEAGADFSGGAGLRLSLIDSKYFHLEAFGEIDGSLGWNPARANYVVAHALELDLDVTALIQDHADLSYTWDQENVGLTIGIPFRPNTVARKRLTFFVSLGYTWLNADVDVKLDESITQDLTALGIDVESVTQRRSIRKESPFGMLGARLDFNKAFSIEASAIFAKTSHTEVYWFSGEATFRFDWPWRWHR